MKKLDTLDVDSFIFSRINGKLCFDIGANCGKKSESYLRMGARVVCVEPDPDCVKKIKERLGSSVEIRECALGKESGVGTLMLSNAPTLNTLSKEFIDVAGKQRFPGYTWPNQIEVPVSTITKMINEYGMPQYCKIDVEGYEEEVLQGSDFPLPFLSFEFTPELKKNADKCSTVLSGRGRYVYNFSRGESQKFVFQEWKEWGDISQLLEKETDFGDIYAMLESVSVLVFSKDRPLFLKAYLNGLLRQKMKITVFYFASSSEYMEAYDDLAAEFSGVDFVCQNLSLNTKSFLLSWLDRATDLIMVTVDDNVCSGIIDVEAIRATMKDPEVFGFTLRLAPGIKKTQDGHVALSTPEVSENGVVIYEPRRFQCPWDYVWEISSTFYRKIDMIRVVESANIVNPNDLEIAGLSLFNAHTAKKMACFNYASLTNVFVDSWASPQCVGERTDDETALVLYREGKEIDVERTFEERDLTGVTHVKNLFLKREVLSNSAIVIIPARNAEKWIEKSIGSVLSQTYRDIGIIFIDDCSEDSTFNRADKLLSRRLDSFVILNRKRKYALENIRFAIKDVCSNPDSVIFVVDGDDWLYSSTAIEEMMEQHKTADVVWSKHECTDGSENYSKPLVSNDIRRHPWVTSHLRTFKKFLFDAINEDDFKDNDGSIYRMAYDVAIMLPVLEMAGFDRRRFYDKVLYQYNRDNPSSDDRVDVIMQHRMANDIRARKPYPIHSRCRVSSVRERLR